MSYISQGKRERGRASVKIEEPAKGSGFWGICDGVDVGSESSRLGDISRND